MINRSTTYIDTDELGLVVQIQHNFGGMVYPFFYTINSSGHRTAVSLFDSHIAEAKALDDNTYQVTLSSTFQVHLDLLYFDIKTPSQAKRITKLEQDVNDVRELLTHYTNALQWKQMNTYLQKQIDDHSKLLADQQTQITNLSKDVSEL